MKSILIVEDSSIETEIYRKLLSKDFLTHFELTAEGALKSIQNNSFDLLVSDANLPGMSGPRLIKTVRANGFCPGISIVAVSGDRKGIEDAIASGADAWFLKPINHKIFQQSLQTILDKKAAPSPSDNFLT
ncbi:hypothetical protein A9Q99_04750 [Gammaproteobacteria bacterium 45_16_T64]|nr:hypothetical protein A9Q99_04750 [Gammaproteobacteria bacterium 45_16_T64]